MPEPNVCSPSQPRCVLLCTSSSTEKVQGSRQDNFEDLICPSRAGRLDLSWHNTWYQYYTGGRIVVFQHNSARRRRLSRSHPRLRHRPREPRDDAPLLGYVGCGEDDRFHETQPPYTKGERGEWQRHGHQRGEFFYRAHRSVGGAAKT